MFWLVKNYFVLGGDNVAKNDGEDINYYGHQVGKLFVGSWQV